MYGSQRRPRLSYLTKAFTELVHAELLALIELPAEDVVLFWVCLEFRNVVINFWLLLGFNTTRNACDEMRGFIGSFAHELLIWEIAFLKIIALNAYKAA